MTEQTTKPEADEATAATASDNATASDSGTTDVAPVAAPAETAPVDTSTDDFVFVTMPDGSTRAFTRAQVRESQARSANEAQNNTFQQMPPQEPEEEVYLWLANGDVEKVKTSQVPGTAGTNALNGYYERDNKMFHVVAVYPVETDK